MNIIIERIYDSKTQTGYRVLVDRLWPRGVSKKQAHLQAHWKELTPSNELRKWFNHEPHKWEEFKKEYLEQLNKKKKLAQSYLEDVTQENLILLYGAKDKQHSHVHILKEYLDNLKNSKEH
jgi:uncharacterized protein YeaO (DUF488 family)